MIEELDVVALRQAYDTKDDVGNPITLPAGMEGTIVDLARDRRSATVEFTNPAWHWEDDGTDSGKHNNVSWVSILAVLSLNEIRLVWQNRTGKRIAEAAHPAAN
jgi:hypothetical protein